MFFFLTSQFLWILLFTKDIRDTVNYKEVMKQYKLGPNGGIVTALNLFSTKFGTVVDLIEKSGNEYKFCVIDTPGQIEVFTWSASGTIITEGLATSFPTIIVYVMDVVRSANPTTFMSNMLYACSILYKSRLPFIVVINKVWLDPAYALNREIYRNYYKFPFSPATDRCAGSSVRSGLDVGFWIVSGGAGEGNNLRIESVENNVAYSRRIL